MQISDAHKAELLALKPDDITKTFIIKTFARTFKNVGGKKVAQKPKFNTTDTFYLNPGEYFVKTHILTTVGRFIYNKLIVERDFQNILGYINDVIDGKKHKQIEAILSDALLYDKISTKQFSDYIVRIQWLGMGFNSILCPSLTEKTIVPIKKVIDTRNKMIDESEDSLEKGNVLPAVKMEKELISIAKDELKNDPGMDLYNSSARGSVENNYKAMYITKGPVSDPITGKMGLVKNAYAEGVSKDDIPVYGNSLITGQYAKSNQTPVAGYMLKRMNASFQAIIADGPGTDCGTSLTVRYKITNSNKNKIVDRYIVDKGKLVLLTEANVGKYVGQEVNMRSTMYCKNQTKKCSKCLGERFYRLGITNVGLMASRASSTILNMNMKKFHDSSANMYEINLADVVI